jgi:energy-converting hydrogenase Eha subunit H
LARAVVIALVVVLVLVLVVVAIGIEKRTAARRRRRKTNDETAATTTAVGRWRSTAAVEDIFDDGGRMMTAAIFTYRRLTSAVGHSPLQLNSDIRRRPSAASTQFSQSSHCRLAAPSPSPSNTIAHRRRLQTPSSISAVERR